MPTSLGSVGKAAGGRLDDLESKGIRLAPTAEEKPNRRPNRTHRVEGEVSATVWQALEAERRRTGESMSDVIERSLATALGAEAHSLYQVSTTSALVKGVFSGAITVADLSTHGDFGIGTFDGLDGELVLLEGTCHRIAAGGAASLAESERTVPFAVVTWFEADTTTAIAGVESLAALEQALDPHRPTQNVFVGIRADGAFDMLSMRAACPAAPDENLVQATAHQSEFTAESIEGTLVGFWAPDYAQAVNVPGYHFHFLSSDRSIGGHVLDVRATSLVAALHIESDIHLALPRTDEFLDADLSGDTSDDLRIAEGSKVEDHDQV